MRKRNHITVHQHMTENKVKVHKWTGSMQNIHHSPTAMQKEKTLLKTEKVSLSHCWPALLTAASVFSSHMSKHIFTHIFVPPANKTTFYTNKTWPWGLVFCCCKSWHICELVDMLPLYSSLLSVHSLWFFHTLKEKFPLPHLIWMCTSTPHNQNVKIQHHFSLSQLLLLNSMLIELIRPIMCSNK